MSKKKSSVGYWHAVSTATTAGFTLVFCIGVGVYLGLVVDRLIGNTVWGLFIGGIGGGILGLYAVLQKMVGR